MIVLAERSRPVRQCRRKAVETARMSMGSAPEKDGRKMAGKVP